MTGSDLVREKLGAWEEKVREIEPLGFGHADLVIAVPDFWDDVIDLHDLDAAAADDERRHPVDLEPGLLPARGALDRFRGVRIGGDSRCADDVVFG